MIKSFRLKLYANKGKLKKIDQLLAFWKDEVQKKIDLYWVYGAFFPKGNHPPKYTKRGGRFIADASLKAWQIVKGAREIQQESKPVFEGNDIDLNSCSIILDTAKKFINSFDFWFKLSTLQKYKRINIPCRKYKYFNRALKQGALKNSGKILKRGKYDYYLQVYIEMPEVEPKATKYLGIDQGLNKPVATSDGAFYGEDLVSLRRRTKWRTYEQIPAYKQGLNRIAKELVSIYPDTNFGLEDLLFKGKHKRSKKFRRNNNNWAYNHLGKRLSQLGLLEGFQVLKVEAKYTSITCPSCDHIAKGNRNDEVFKCQECGYTNHTDTVGAINVRRRMLKSIRLQPLVHKTKVPITLRKSTQGSFVP